MLFALGTKIGWDYKPKFFSDTFGSFESTFEITVMFLIKSSIPIQTPEGLEKSPRQ